MKFLNLQYNHFLFFGATKKHEQLFTSQLDFSILMSSDKYLFSIKNPNPIVQPIITSIGKII